MNTAEIILIGICAALMLYTVLNAALKNKPQQAISKVIEKITQRTFVICGYNIKATTRETAQFKLSKLMERKNTKLYAKEGKEILHINEKNLQRKLKTK